MAQVYIGIGSNIDREQNIRAGLRELCKQFSNVKQSTIYESRAVGFEGENFYNLVAGLQTSLTPEKLQENLHEIESQFGRTRGGPRYVSRTLDLDLLLYDDVVCDGEGIQLPREDVCKFAFVLRPLSEIAGNLRHPVSGESYAELWKRFDQTDQELWPVEMTM